MKKKVLRILDANLNRCREGLRVSEEVARFVLGSRALTMELKGIRHGISDVARSLSGKRGSLFLSRETESDVGRGSGMQSERSRNDCADIFFANIGRAKESLRVLEEFSKLVNKHASARFEALRFRVYDVEKKAFKRISALRK